MCESRVIDVRLISANYSWCPEARLSVEWTWTQPLLYAHWGGSSIFFFFKFSAGKQRKKLTFTWFHFLLMQHLAWVHQSGVCRAYRRRLVKLWPCGSYNLSTKQQSTLVSVTRGGVDISRLLTFQKKTTKQSNSRLVLKKAREWDESCATQQ